VGLTPRHSLLWACSWWVYPDPPAGSEYWDQRQTRDYWLSTGGRTRCIGIGDGPPCDGVAAVMDYYCENCREAVDEGLRDE
jgi:hypothetical protein